MGLPRIHTPSQLSPASSLALVVFPIRTVGPCAKAESGALLALEWDILLFIASSHLDCWDCICQAACLPSLLLEIPVNPFLVPFLAITDTWTSGEQSSLHRIFWSVCTCSSWPDGKRPSVFHSLESLANTFLRSWHQPHPSILLPNAADISILLTFHFYTIELLWRGTVPTPDKPNPNYSTSPKSSGIAKQRGCHGLSSH